MSNDPIIDVEPIYTQIVVCPACGRKNRILTERDVQFRCGECKYIFKARTPDKYEKLRLNIERAGKKRWLPLVAFVIVAFYFAIRQSPRPAPLAKVEATPAVPVERESPRSVPRIYIPLALDPYHKAWPSRAGYLKDTKRLRDGGMCEITVDNSRNDNSVHGILKYNPDGNLCQREFFIPAQSKFKMARVATGGDYFIDYKNLSTGQCTRTDFFGLKEVATNDGISYSTVRVTLYTVVGGNLKTHPISDDLFNGVRP